MELKEYIRPLLKWWQLIVVATVLSGVSSFWVTLGQPLNYQSRTTLLVGSALSNPNPESGQIYLAGQLATIYAQFARGDTVYTATREALDMTWLPEYNIRVIPNTQLIEITVIDVIPERAQIVTGELANQIILLSPGNSTAGGTNRQEFIDEQLDTLQNQIISTSDKILSLQQELGTLNSARDIESTEIQISALESKLATLQQNYSNLLVNTTEGAVNTIQIIEPATLPGRPIGPNKLLIVAITAMTGAVIAGAAAYLLDFLSKNLDSVDDIKREFPLPMLGEIPALSKQESKDSWVFVDQQPLSGFAEAFRRLRTNIDISTQDDQIRTMLVSSGSEADGKSTVAVNLAIAFSYLGKKVILVDADFRKHRIHEALDLSLEPGLNELLAGEKKLDDVIQHWKGNIFAISSGKFMPNSSELVSSSKFTTVMEQLYSIADLIIIDGPPFFLSETSSISNRVDGVLLVVSVGSSKELVRKMKNQLDIIRSTILGLVANRVGANPSYYGNYYSSYNVPTRPVGSDVQEASSQRISIFESVFSVLRDRMKRDDSKSTPKLAQDVEEESQVVPSSEVKASQNVKTIPRILNPKDFLDKIILKTSKKSVDEDKEYLQEIARRKRDQTYTNSDISDFNGNDTDLSLEFLNSLDANEEFEDDTSGDNGFEEISHSDKDSGAESEDFETEQKSEGND